MPPDPRNSLDNPLWAISGLGVEFFAAIAGMGLIGWAIDRFIVGSGNSALLICLVIGILAGGSNFIRQALALNRKAAADYRQWAARRPSTSKAPPPLPPEKHQPSSPPSPPGHGWFHSDSPSSDDDSSPQP